MPLSRRQFLKSATAATLFAGLPMTGTGCANLNPARDTLAKILIIGGGAEGVAMAAALHRELPKATLTLVEPSEEHCYRAGLHLVATSFWKAKDISKREAEVLPSGLRWIQESVAGIDACQNQVELVSGEVIRYDFLVLVPELKRDWSSVPGLDDHVLGQGRLHSIDTPEAAAQARSAIQELVRTGGRGIFVNGPTQMASDGVSQSLCLLTENFASRRQTRSRLTFDYYTATDDLFDIPFYTPRLEQIFKDRQIGVSTAFKLTGVEASASKAIFEDLRTGETHSEGFDCLLVAPMLSAPDFVRQSGLGWSEGDFAAGGWVMVDPKTLIHRDHANIIAFGDAAGLSSAKTLGAIKSQLPVALANLSSLIMDQAPSATYNGYTCCPILTDEGHALMCEYDDSRRPTPTFPYSLFSPAEEQRLGWIITRYLQKPCYFHLTLRGQTISA